MGGALVHHPVARYGHAAAKGLQPRVAARHNVTTKSRGRLRAGF